MSGRTLHFAGASGYGVQFFFSRGTWSLRDDHPRFNFGLGDGVPNAGDANCGIRVGDLERPRCSGFGQRPGRCGQVYRPPSQSPPRAQTNSICPVPVLADVPHPHFAEKHYRRGADGLAESGIVARVSTKDGVSVRLAKCINPQGLRSPVTDSRGGAFLFGPGGGLFPHWCRLNPLPAQLAGVCLVLFSDGGGV